MQQLHHARLVKQHGLVTQVVLSAAARNQIKQEWIETSCHLMLQGKELSDAVTEGLRSVNLLADEIGDKLVSSYRSVCWHQPEHETSWLRHRVGSLS